MKKLIEGIKEFRKNPSSYKDLFAKLALGQKPDALFVACSDSRVAANVFASTNPGDLFVIRNMGNMISPCNKDGHSTADESEAAAIEFALKVLNVKDIIVCGHSECGAMQALVEGREKAPGKHIQEWLRHGEPALKKLRGGETLSPELTLHNQLSQLNVLNSIENLKSYPVVQERIANKTLGFHAWWFDLAHADVYAYDFEARKYKLIE